MKLSEKVRRGHRENALKAKNIGSSIPLGYVLNKETKKLEINEITAPTVLEIFKRYAAGDTISSIKDDFNQRGLKTNNGCAFRYSTFNTVLKNRKYIGEYKYHDIVIPDGVPAIIPVDLFERIQTRMEKNKRTPAASKAEE